MIDKDKVIQLAKEAGLANQFPTAPMLDMFERFAQAIYRQGLEDAAKVAEAMQPQGGRPWNEKQHLCFAVLNDCSSRIRSLKESTNG